MNDSGMNVTGLIRSLNESWAVRDAMEAALDDRSKTIAKQDEEIKRLRAKFGEAASVEAQA